MEKVELRTADIAAENAAKLAELFPDIVTEVLDEDGNVRHSIDVEALKAHVGDIAEDKRERYQFTWPGKQKARAEAIRPIDKTMRPCVDESVNWDTTENLYIEGDNLDALKILRETYAGAVDIIYIDPPYNTGTDLIYNDTFFMSEFDAARLDADYDEDGGRMVRNLETKGSFHSDWCSMIYPRLLLARDLLADDGALFISIDECESENLRKITDEVFGPTNFVAELAWAGGRKNDSQFISVSHEYVLCYAKSKQLLKDRKTVWREKKQGLEEIYAKYDELRLRFGDNDREVQRGLKAWFKSLPASHPSKAHKHYSSVDGNGVYFAADISWPGGGGPKYEVLHPATGRPVAVPSRGWLFGTAERMKEVVESGRVEFGPDETKVPCYKRYLKECELQAPYSVIYKDGRAASKRLDSLMGAKVFDNPKDEEILQKILSLPQKRDALIMDFFAGSGTTAHACMKLNAEDGGSRRFIVVQYPENLDENLSHVTKASAKAVLKSAISLCNSLQEPHVLSVISKERIRRAGAKIAAEVEESNAQFKLDEEPGRVPDIGFRVLKIDSSNFEDVSRTPDTLFQDALFSLADNVKPGRTPEDILFQLFPKLEIPYTARIDTFDICGKTVYSVDDDTLVACFDRGVPEDVVRAMAEREPAWAVLRDASFTGDDALANFEEIFKTVSPETKTRVV
ncbi:MAG: site-specific DNA-methyltransferase [Collinsella intestinalis]